MTPEELRDLALRAVSTPLLEAPAALAVLVDVLLELGTIKEGRMSSGPGTRRYASSVRLGIVKQARAWAMNHVTPQLLTFDWSDVSITINGRPVAQPTVVTTGFPIQH